MNHRFFTPFFWLGLISNVGITWFLLCLTPRLNSWWSQMGVPDWAYFAIWYGVVPLSLLVCFFISCLIGRFALSHTDSFRRGALFSAPPLLVLLAMAPRD